MSGTTALRIAAAMPPDAAPAYPGAVWIGTVDERDVTAELNFTGLAGYAAVRLLVRSGRAPRGFVQLPVTGGRVDPAALTAAVAALPPVAAPPAVPTPPVTVVLCTYDRPQLLASALRSAVALDYPQFEIVVVDNHPGSGLTAPVVEACGDPRVRLVVEPRRGLARARNTGVLAARFGHVAFTDDDVLLDRSWLRGVADGFAAGPRVGCVAGIVASGEIASPAQAYFDQRVSWATRCQPDLFSLRAPRPHEPLFPFQVGRFGTGANFAVRVDTLVALGGFDERLGVGSPGGGGEDIDLFVRMLLAGYELAYAPTALVWHKHRRDVESLRRQIDDYGTGLGAWMTKMALNPRTLAMMLRRVRPGIAHYRRITAGGARPADPWIDVHRLGRAERRAVLGGPLALLRGHLAGARARPLDDRPPHARPEEER